jgi:hypothetical protein
MAELQPPDDQTDRPLTNKQTYNIVSDTVVGPNLRYKDNLYQGITIGVCLILGGLIGCLAVTERAMGALAGAFAGMVVGLFGSGIFLMVYRAIKHLRGRHD